MNYNPKNSDSYGFLWLLDWRVFLMFRARFPIDGNPMATSPPGWSSSCRRRPCRLLFTSATAWRRVRWQHAHDASSITRTIWAKRQCAPSKEEPRRGPRRSIEAWRLPTWRVVYHFKQNGTMACSLKYKYGWSRTRIDPIQYTDMEHMHTHAHPRKIRRRAYTYAYSTRYFR